MSPKIIPIEIDLQQLPFVYMTVCDHDYEDIPLVITSCDVAIQVKTEIICRGQREVFVDDHGYGYRYMYAGQCPDCGQIFSFVSQVFREIS